MSCVSSGITGDLPARFAAAAAVARARNNGLPRPLPICPGCQWPIDPDGADSGFFLLSHCAMCEGRVLEKFLRRLVDGPTRRKRRQALKALERLADAERRRLGGRSARRK
jgi:hypothetical protein